MFFKNWAVLVTLRGFKIANFATTRSKKMDKKLLWTENYEQKKNNFDLSTTNSVFFSPII